MMSYIYRLVYNCDCYYYYNIDYDYDEIIIKIYKQNNGV